MGNLCIFMLERLVITGEVGTFLSMLSLCFCLVVYHVFRMADGKASWVKNLTFNEIIMSKVDSRLPKRLSEKGLGNFGRSLVTFSGGP